MNHQGNDFVRRVFIVAGVALLAFLVISLMWQAAEALLVIFAGILVAVLLRAIADGFSSVTNIPSGWSLAIVVLILVAVFGLGGWFLADRIVDQISQLRQTLPMSLQQIEAQVRQTSVGQYVLEQAEDGGMMEESRVWSRAFGFLSSLLGLLGSLIIVIFVALYLAAEPETYRHGFTLLFPPQRRERVGQVMDRLCHMLRWWLLGQIVSMTCVATLITVGLWLLDIPLALTLGLIAGLVEFIPRFGPLFGAIPAILIALNQGPQSVIWVILLYAGVQVLESYVILPLVQRKAVDLPPALTITVLFLMGILFGFVGLLLAAPLTVVIMSLVKQLYVEDPQEASPDSPG